MPKVVDHEQRRAELRDAVWRLASRDGLEAVTVRAVADEAGCSTGALVHYFADKEDLLLFAFRTVADRVMRRVAAAEEATTDPMELARAMLVEGLPLDRERQAEVRLWFAFLGLALTRPALARDQRLTYRAWRERVADRLAEAKEQGILRADVDPEHPGGRAGRPRGRTRRAGHLRAARARHRAAARARGRVPGPAPRVVASRA